LKRAVLKDFLLANGFVTVQSSRERHGVVSHPLHEAAAQGNVDIVRLLMEAGANPAKLDSKGRTAEQVAEAKNRFGGKDEVIAALRDAAAALAMYAVDEAVE